MDLRQNEIASASKVPFLTVRRRSFLYRKHKRFSVDWGSGKYLTTFGIRWRYKIVHYLQPDSIVQKQIVFESLMWQIKWKYWQQGKNPGSTNTWWPSIDTVAFDSQTQALDGAHYFGAVTQQKYLLVRLWLCWDLQFEFWKTVPFSSEICCKKPPSLEE